MQNMLFSGVSRPSRFLNDLYFTTCFKSYYRAAVVKYSGYLVLSANSFTVFNEDERSRRKEGLSAC